MKMAVPPRLGDYLIISLLCVTFLAACGADDHQQAVHSDIEAYRPNTNWTGLLYCSGRTFPLTLTINTLDDHSVSGQISVSGAIQRAGKTAAGYSLFGGGAIENGSYYPYSREVRFTTEDENNRKLALSALLSADGERAVLRTTVGRGRPCELGIIASSDSDDFIERLAADISAIQANIQPDAAGQCSKPVREWLAAAAGIEKDANNRVNIDPVLSEDVFNTIFGKPYTEFSAAEVLETGAQLTAYCLSRDDSRELKQIAARLAGEISNRRYFEISRFNVFREDVIRSWQQRTRSLLASGLTMTHTQAAQLAAMPQAHRFADVVPDEIVEDRRTEQQKAQTRRFDFSPLMPKVAIVDELSDYASEMGNREQALNFAELLLGSKDDFVRFTTLYGNIMNNLELDNTPATEVYKRHLEASAVAYVSGEEISIAELAYMQQWIQATTGEHGCAAEVADTCDDAAAIFSQAIDDRIEYFVDQDLEALEVLEEEGEQLTTLANLVTLNNAQQQKYGALAAHRDVAELLDEAADLRWALQEDLEEDLLDKLAEQKSTPQIRRFESTYFLLGDLDKRAVADLKDALYQARQYAQPFRGNDSSDYLNALYNQDFDRLRQLDRSILQSVAPLLGLYRQQVETMIALGEALTGVNVPANNPLTAKLKLPSALGLVAGTYLLHYGREYEDCLKPNALQISYSKRTDTAYKNSMGFTMYTIKGVTVYEDYAINPEFRDMFYDYFSSENDRNTANFMDAIFNGSQLSGLRRGTLATMKKYDCDAPEIGKLEQGMRAYYAHLKRLRMSG